MPKVSKNIAFKNCFFRVTEDEINGEKTLKDMGDKVDAAEVADINKAKDDLKAALEGNDTAEIKAKTEALQDVLYKMTEKMYAQAQAAQGADMGGYSQSAPNEDGVYDAEYKEV